MSDDNNFSRRRFLKATGAVASATAITGCQSTPGGEGTATETEGGMEEESPTATETETESVSDLKEVRSVSGTMDTMDPIKATDTASGSKIQNIFDALTNYPNGQTNVENLLAEDYETSNGGRTFTFTLKQGVTYNNGDEVTAQDAVYSFERLAASPNSRRKGFLLNDLGVEHETTTTEVQQGNETVEQEVYEPGTLGVTAEDDYTLTIQLSSPFHATLEMLAYSAFSLVPEGLVGDPTKDDGGDLSYQEFATQNPVGAGPYELDTWEQGTEMRLTARADYHGETPKNSGIHYKVLSESNAIFTYATDNVNADFPYIPDSKYKPSLVNIERTDDRGRRIGTYGPFAPNNMTAQYYEVPTVSTFYTAFNCEAVEKPVRQAFAYAFSQKEFAESIHSGPEKEAYFFTPPAIFPGGASRYDDLAQDYPYGYQEARLQKAKQVMENAGYGPDNKYELAFDMPQFTASTYGQDYFNLMRDKLTTAHIELSLRTAEWSTFLNRGRNGKFEAHFLGWIADYPAPDNFLQLLYPPMTDTESDNFLSYINWSTENGDAAQQAIDAWKTFENNPGLNQSAQQARNQAYVQIEKANWEDAAMITMFHGISQNYAYEWVDAPLSGAMGGSRGKDHLIEIGDRGQYE